MKLFLVMRDLSIGLLASVDKTQMRLFLHIAIYNINGGEIFGLMKAMQTPTLMLKCQYFRDRNLPQSRSI